MKKKIWLRQWRAATRDLQELPLEEEGDGVDEVEVQVEATALNFRDVMWAQGLLPRDLLEGGFAGPSLGMECSGVVSRAGSGASPRRP